jgi:hypothetical protein
MDGTNILEDLIYYRDWLTKALIVEAREQALRKELKAAALSLDSYEPKAEKLLENLVAKMKAFRIFDRNNIFEKFFMTYAKHSMTKIA